MSTTTETTEAAGSNGTSGSDGSGDRSPAIATTDRPGVHWTGSRADSEWIATARRIAPRLAESAVEHDRDGSFVADGIELAREHGLLAMLVPTELGGGGATHGEACAVLSELAHGCPATSLTLSMHSHLVAAQAWRHHRGLPAPVLAKVADRHLCLISTGASDWLDSSGSAVEVDGGFRVTARKLPASGCPAGDVLATSIRWDDAPDGPQVIHCSIPFTAEGVSIQETWDTLGMRGTGSHTVVLDDVFVPADAVALTRPAGEWHPVWATVLGAALPLIMSSYVGVAEAAAERAVALARRRADRPEVVAQVGRLHNRLTAARDAVAAMIVDSDDLRFDNTIEHADVALRRKTNAADACIDVARIALEVGGGAGYAVGGGVERLFRDVHGSLYHPLPAAQQETFTGERLLGGA